jgi:SAM-dependent methyltransferase
MDRFVGTYEKWNRKRLQAILDHYGASFFPGKTILTVGCGHGAIAYELQKLGAKVTYVDARQEHVDFIAQRDSESIAICMDIDKEWPEGQWDVLIHFGVLYHLKHPERNLKRACASATHLILETEVVDSKGDAARKEIREKSHIYTQSTEGTGVRLGPIHVEKILRESDMTFKRLWNSSCNAGIHKYDWKPKNKNDWKPGQRRFWFVKRNYE